MISQNFPVENRLPHRAHDNNKEGDTKVGDFYIDSSDGKVYRSDEHGKTFAEYDFSDYK